MTDHAAFKATYSDWRIVKGRKVVQLSFEIPLEAADEAYGVLGGMPDPSTSRWFGIARLQPANSAPEASEPKGKEERHWENVPLSQQAAIRCNDQAFIRFMDEMLGGDDSMTIEEAVRWHCGVASRADIRKGTPAGNKWGRLEEEFQAWLRNPAYA